MEIKIEGNPGTGNTFQEVKIGTVQNYNPNATTVINNNYGSYPKSREDLGAVDRTALRQEIINYVSKTLKLVEKKWRDGYLDLWNDILDLKEVSAVIYDRGRQKGTVFNRRVVANILYTLGNFRNNDSGLFGDYKASTLATELEGTTRCSTRTELGSHPEPEIREAVQILLKDKGIS